MLRRTALKLMGIGTATLGSLFSTEKTQAVEATHVDFVANPPKFTKQSKTLGWHGVVHCDKPFEVKRTFHSSGEENEYTFSTNAFEIITSKGSVILTDLFLNDRSLLRWTHNVKTMSAGWVINEAMDNIHLDIDFFPKPAINHIGLDIGCKERPVECPVEIKQTWAYEADRYSIPRLHGWIELPGGFQMGKVPLEDRFQHWKLEHNLLPNRMISQTMKYTFHDLHAINQWVEFIKKNS